LNVQQPTAIRRITLGMVCLILSIYLVARSLGVIPERLPAVLEGRKDLCEALATSCSLAAERDDLATIKRTLKAVVERNPGLHSAGIRQPDGRLMLEVGPHRAYWGQGTNARSATTHVAIPITRGGARWGTLELCFTPPVARDPLGLFALDDVRTVLFLAAGGCLVFYLYLSKVLSYLNPASVIPQRVRNTLNTLAEGLLVLDAKQRIVLANESFARTLGEPADRLQGRAVSDLPWGELTDDGGEYPWAQAMTEGSLKTGAVLKLEHQDRGTRIFRVNSTPIVDDNGSCLGALASFDDVTLLEQRNATLGDALAKLKASRDLIRQQNEQLRTLATRDSLTGCLNRRALFEELEKMLLASRQAGLPLSGVLVDIDHFKAVNDTHGHAAGDHVLQMVSGVLRERAGEDALVGRYGGEEFCVILPTERHEARRRVDLIRQAIEQSACDAIRVTASFGVSDTEMALGGVRDLLEQADQALYAAKHRGRNQVVLWDSVRQETPGQMQGKPEPRGPEADVSAGCVSGLLACLGYRHPPAAEHAHRVAELCLAAARGLLPERDRALLEAAALVHDVGLLGVPDAILFKRGKLTDDEWRVLRTHERIGYEVIAAVFRSEELSQIVRGCRCWYDGSRAEADGPSGNAIPMAARILAIAEAFDAMIYDRSYRPARSQEQAVAELRRCAGTQFDPELVERVIAALPGGRAAVEVQSPSSSQAAMRIGLHLEKLACALDAEDATSLALLAGQLKGVAEEHSLEDLAAAAGTLEVQARQGADWAQLVHLGAELSELCHTAQQTLVAASGV
jgi:diguanylate cyclase (GGDEF)-like protein/PAS domain S-box-containing protein